MNKETLGVVAGSLITFTVLAINLISAVEAEETDYFTQQKVTSHLLINLFLQKLGKEQLQIYQHAVTKSDLVSHQVSYVHNITDDSVRARLHFKLKDQWLIPGFEEYFVEGIVVEMNKNGKILEVSTHVSRQSLE